MKNNGLLCYFLLSMGLLLTACEKNKGAFFVEANCEECVTILMQETENLPGIISSQWIVESSFLEVTYGSTSLETIQEALSEKGFSTQFYLANDSAKQLLPACCSEPLNRTLDVYTPKVE